MRVRVTLTSTQSGLIELGVRFRSTWSSLIEVKVRFEESCARVMATVRLLVLRLMFYSYG